MTTKNQIKKAKILSSQGETRLIDGKKTLILPCIDLEYSPKKRKTSRGKIASKMKRLG